MSAETWLSITHRLTAAAKADGDYLTSLGLCIVAAQALYVAEQLDLARESTPASLWPLNTTTTYR